MSFFKKNTTIVPNQTQTKVLFVKYWQQNKIYNIYLYTNINGKSLSQLSQTRMI